MSINWRGAIKNFNAMMKNKTWKLVSSSPSYDIVGNKWVSKMKRDSDVSVQRLKARLVAKGFH